MNLLLKIALFSPVLLHIKNKNEREAFQMKKKNETYQAALEDENGVSIFDELEQKKEKKDDNKTQEH